MDILSTTRFNFTLAEALLNADSIALSFLDDSFNVKELNKPFKETLRLSSCAKHILDFGLFEEEELQGMTHLLLEKKKRELFFQKNISFEDGVFKILQLRLIGVYEEETFKGLFIFLEDITANESAQLALKAVANNYVQKDIFLFFNDISKDILEIFNVSMLMISFYDQTAKDDSVRFISTIEKSLSFEEAFRFNSKDYLLEHDAHPLEEFFQFSEKNLERINSFFEINLMESRGVVLKNRKGEKIGTLTLACQKLYKNQDLIHKVLPIFSKKIAYEMEHSISLAKHKENEAFFKKLYKESPLGIIMISPHTARILRANARICKLLGYSEKELKEKTMYEISHPEDQEKHKKKYKASLGVKNSAFNFEKRLIKKNGHAIWVRVEASIIRDDHGVPLYDLATCVDISDAKTGRDIIDSQIAALNIQNEKLAKYIDSNLQLENFAYIASHDLKAPLRTIGNFSQILKRRLSLDLGQEEMEFLDFIIEGVKDMDSLIEDLLLYSKVNSTENSVTKLDVQHIVNNVLRNLDAIIQSNQAKIIIEDLPKNIIANKTKLTQLFQNLLANGMKFQKAGNTPEIHLKGEEKEKCWLFQISDNGIGIEKVYHEKIFTLFKRLHGKGEYEGSGIGLAYCKRVVEKHEGDIWLESEVGKGTTFFFTIMKPLAK